MTGPNFFADNRGVSFRHAGAVGALLAAAATMIVQPALAQPVTDQPMGRPLSSVAAARAAAMIAANRALSDENTPPTTFQSVVSLNDPDVVAAARAASDRAGHDGLYYDYFRFISAINTVREKKADKLDIPHGTYHIYPPASFNNGQGLINLVNLSHVTIEGNGSTLLFAYLGKPDAPLTAIHSRAGIHINRSDHIALTNLTMDWDEALAVPVAISGTGQPGSPQSLTVNSAFPINPAMPMPISSFIPFNVAQRRFLLARDMAPADLAAWQAERSPHGSLPYGCGSSSLTATSTCFRHVSGQIYAFGPNEHFHPVPPHANTFLGTVRDNLFAAILGDGYSSFVAISGVTIYNSPGTGITLIGTGPAIHIKKLRIVRKPDALLAPGEQPRYLSTVADGLNFLTTAGDIALEDSEIANQGDDGLNVNAALRRAQAIDPHTVRTANIGLLNYWRVGGLVDVYDDKGGNLLAKGVPIAAVVTPPAPGQQVTVTLPSGSAPLVAGASYQLRVRDFDSTRILVRNNWFHDSSERGVIAHGSDIAVIQNRFDRTAESAVQALYDNQTGNAEGPPIENLLIAGNTIHDVNDEWFDSTYRSVAAPAAIAVYLASRSGFASYSEAADGNVFARHVMITNNAIDSVPGAGILVSQAQDVVVADNQVTNVGKHAFGMPVVDGNAVVVERSAGVNISGNNVDAPIIRGDR
ncbi:right-handed parallel beta-helix repeat-containing protein [Telmatospirillum sp.]|uniref:right-handed parallel beta-helix repeat-containing protein n=1 Tax=Telmatospirillum sp. TaxID=2079197 RepID=UPI00283FAD41|nr:right-handed parallel beta-helix repeat-containing protein [Telmatospirillum sp.]MDR3437819.1 right-handed parallel beta-helix repeat-containing protein [Telmatospirillum sp.]